MDIVAACGVSPFSRSVARRSAHWRLSICGSSPINDFGLKRALVSAVASSLGRVLLVSHRVRQICGARFLQDRNYKPELTEIKGC